MELVPALILPIPNLKHDTPLSFVRIENRTMNKGTPREDFVVIPDARNKRSSDAEFRPDLDDGLREVRFGE